MMDDFTIAIYCFADDFRKKMHPKEDVKRKLNDAEVITTAVVAARYFSGNFVKSRNYMQLHWGCTMPHKSNFNRLLHRLSWLLVSIFHALGTTLKQLNTHSIYIIDSFPVAICRNIRIPRSRLIRGEGYRGYNASKKEYFYGFKVQVIVTQQGVPVDFFMVAGSIDDVTAFQAMTIDLPSESELHADSAYTDYELEELYGECEAIQVMVQRKKNSKHQDHPAVAYRKKRSENALKPLSLSWKQTFPELFMPLHPKDAC